MPTKEQVAAQATANINKSYLDNTLANLRKMGWAEEDIASVESAIKANPISSDNILSKLSVLETESTSKLASQASKDLKKEAKALAPKKDTESINGAKADPIVEPINKSNITEPTDIEDDTNSLESDHPATFGSKDRAGNWVLFNLVRKLFQAGLKNGFLFRSDKVGNTTIKIPKNLKVHIVETLNVNSLSSEYIVEGEIYLEATESITIKAPKIIIDGDLEVTGTQTNKKTIDADQDITSKGLVTGNVDVIFAGTNCLTHIHTAQGSKALTTPPI